MNRLNTKTLEAFPDDASKRACIETLAGVFYVLADELRKHANLETLPTIVGYHIGLGMGILGAVLGKIKRPEFKSYDVTYSDADYDQKLELVIECLIRMRDTCRERRKNV